MWIGTVKMASPMSWDVTWSSTDGIGFRKLENISSIPGEEANMSRARKAKHKHGGTSQLDVFVLRNNRK